MRETMLGDLQNGSGHIFEEIIIMQERVHELGTQTYEMMRDSKMRFANIDNYDLKIIKSDQHIKDL